MKSVDRDAYGHEIYDAYLGSDATEIVERDDGYITASVFGPKMYLAEYRHWPRYEKEAIKYARGRVLDIGCGGGRHSLHMQKKGHDVLGIDLSPLAVKVCRLRGLKKAKTMSITQISRKQGIFDSILMFGNNFGLFANRNRCRWLLRRFHNMTSEHGRIIAASLDPYQTDDPAHKSYQRRNRNRGRMSGQIRLRIRHKQYIGDWFDYLLVSKDEMKSLLKGSGWKVKCFIDKEETSFYISIIEKE